MGASVGAVAGGAAGGAVSAAIVGGVVGMGALTGAISGAIGMGLSQFNMHVLDGVFSEYAISTLGGALGGGVGAELMGGDFGTGAAYGAMGGAIGSGIYTLFKFAQNPKQLSNAREEAGEAIMKAMGEGLDRLVNDNKYGHAAQASIYQRALGPLAAPFITAGGILYEGFHIFFPGHTQDNHVSFYQSLKPFYGFFDGQHPSNWLFDTPGDVLANTLGQFSGLFWSPAAGDQVNKAGFMIPGPDYTGPEPDFTKLTSPGAKFPW